MATPKFVNRARMLTSTTGTGSSLTLTAAVFRYFTFSEAGLQDGDVVDYVIEDGNDFEIQVGQTYSSAGPSLSRGTPAASKVGGVAGTSQINLTGDAQVFITAVAESFDISRYTEQTIITEDDLLLGYSDADGERRKFPIGGVLAACLRVDADQGLLAAEVAQARKNLQLGTGPLSGFRNKIINGDGRINQREASTIGDDTYGHDRHYALTQTGNITVSTLTAPADGIASMMRLTQPSGTAKRMGYAQIIEAIETYPLRGRTVTLGGKLRCSSATPIRFAILEWTGTADQVTSDVVNNWTSTNYTAGNFFIPGLTVAAVGSITPAANTITNWSITATISASANNLIAFYWTEGAVAQNATLDMRWYLVEGDATAEDDPFSVRHSATELYLCRRYARRDGFGTIGRATASTTVAFFVTFDPVMRASPTFYIGGSGSLVVDNGNAAASAETPIADADASVMREEGGRLFVRGFNGLTEGTLWPITESSRYLFLDAEL